MKPIREHNAEMEAHSRKWFPPDPGRRPVCFVYKLDTQCWIAFSREIPAAPDWLNYDGKMESLPLDDGRITILRRRDMTEAEFKALPITDEKPA